MAVFSSTTGPHPVLLQATAMEEPSATQCDAPGGEQLLPRKAARISLHCWPTPPVLLQAAAGRFPGSGSRLLYYHPLPPFLPQATVMEEPSATRRVPGGEQLLPSKVANVFSTAGPVSCSATSNCHGGAAALSQPKGRAISKVGGGLTTQFKDSNKNIA